VKLYVLISLYNAGCSFPSTSESDHENGFRLKCVGPDSINILPVSMSDLAEIAAEGIEPLHPGGLPSDEFM